jgi:hypothetical protein
MSWVTYYEDPVDGSEKSFAKHDDLGDALEAWKEDSAKIIYLAIGGQSVLEEDLDEDEEETVSPYGGEPENYLGCSYDAGEARLMGGLIQKTNPGHFFEPLAEGAGVAPGKARLRKTDDKGVLTHEYELNPDEVVMLIRRARGLPDAPESEGE